VPQTPLNADPRIIALQEHWPLLDLPDEGMLAFWTLERADSFVAGKITSHGLLDGEVALRVLLKQKRKTDLLIIIASIGPTVEGRLYALTALHILDKKAYRTFANSLLRQPSAQLREGDLGSVEPVASLLKGIESGKYNALVANHDNDAASNK